MSIVNLRKAAIICCVLYGVENVALSMPTIIGMYGGETLIPVRLDFREQRKLRERAYVLRGVINDVL